MRKTEEEMTFDNIELEPEQETILGIVIEPGIKDCSDQVLSKEEIAEACQIYNACFGNILLQHRDRNANLPDFNDLVNIQTLENWQHTFNDKVKIINSFVTSEDSLIENEKVIGGSWLMELQINDPEIRKAVDNGYLRGLSYGGAGCLFPVNSHIQVVDLLPAEISLVDYPCNRKGWLRKAEQLQKKYPSEMACRLREPGQFQEDSFVRMTRESKGKEYHIILARLKGKESLTEQAYRYNKTVWQESQARQHCSKHKGLTFEPAKEK
ncbi:hypothetical protein ES707_16960 [subsurface metagenome]